MGWSTGDEERVEEAKLLLVAAKAAVYKLRQSVASIRHNEKSVALVKFADQGLEKLGDVEIHLNR